MPLSDTYRDALKRRALEDFIQANKRSPTRNELVDLLQQYQVHYPTIDQTGFSGIDVQKVQFNEVSSAAKENRNKRAIFDDLFALSKRSDNLTQLLEDSFRGFTSTGYRTSRLLRQLESKLDNLILLNSKVDVFAYGIEETFDTQEYIDLTNSTAAIESGCVTLGRTGYNVVSLDQIKVTASAYAQDGVLGTTSSSDISKLREDDGVFWNYLVFTRRRTGRVTCSIDLVLDAPASITDIRIAGNPVNMNGKMVVSIFYSVDGQTFASAGIPEQQFIKGENQYNIGRNNVQKIRLLFSKEAADDTTSSGDQFVYIFSFDSIKLFIDTYVKSKESTLLCGPYTIEDEDGQPIYYTKATLEACTIAPENTSVSFFLSKDGVQYTPVNYLNKSLAVVSFGSRDTTGTYDFFEDTFVADALVIDPPSDLEVAFNQDGVCNRYILASSVAKVPIKSIQVKRNVPVAGLSVYGVASGWYFDDMTSQYNTTVDVQANEGRYLDLGSSSAYVNGTLSTGQVHLKPGINTFTTSDINWSEITTGLTDIQQLKLADTLYPFNHKLLIEGYAYPKSFVGEQIYNGAGTYFGRQLQYVPSEEFDTEEYRYDMSVYTTVYRDGDLYFKVKVDKTDASWQQELINIDYLVQSSSSNELYVKAILRTSDSIVTPLIDNFKVRVI